MKCFSLIRKRRTEWPTLFCSREIRITGKLVFAGLNGQSRSLLTTDYNNVAPRVGFAYTIPQAGNLVVRGAYGIFYAQDQGMGVTNRLTSNPPFFGYGSISLISDQVNTSTAFLSESEQQFAAAGADIAAAVHLGSFRDFGTGELVSACHHSLRSGMEFQRAKAVSRQFPC